MNGTQSHDRGVSIADRIEAVSPSRYGMLRAWKEGKICSLQLLWRGKPPLAPYPAAKLGDVVHLMLDRHPAGAGEAEAKLAWDEALAHTESKLSNDWVTRGLLPLSRTVRRYSLKRILSIRSVLQSVSISKFAGTRGGQSSTLREEDLQSADGLLKGRADLIEQRDGKWVLVDYKSGEVHEDDEESGRERVKDEYAMQLRLYANLIREAKGIIIHQAFLRTLDGCEHEVDVDEASVSGAGAEARSLLSEFNNEVRRHGNPIDLAKPMAASWERGLFGCAGCLFRPLCPAYLGSKKVCHPDERWPKDAWGKVTAMERIDGTVMIQIRNENRLVGPDGDAPDPVVNVKLNDSTSRHPGLSEIEIGGSAQVFDFLVPRLRVDGVEGPRTCVHVGAVNRGGRAT